MAKLFAKSYLLIFISLIALTLVSCIAQETDVPVELSAVHTYQAVPTNMPELSAIEGNADIKFPPSAHEIYAYTSGLNEIFILVRFSMDANELDTFTSTTLCTQPLSETKIEPGLNGNLKWWAPEGASQAMECFGENEHSHQHVIIDISDTSIYIVYISTSTY